MTLLEEAVQLSPKLIAWRRHLHAHPELSFDEHETQAFLLRELEALGFDAVKPIADTGIEVMLTGALPGPCIALRADLDALPIQEVAGRAYGSQVPGVMHACGHDVHTTCALGALVLLSQKLNTLRGSIKVVFQPGEELLPGGATKVIADGFLESPKVAAIIGLHVAPALPVGTYGIRAGQYMASADEVYLTLRGPGGHAALPHQSVDLVATAGQLLVALQQVQSRKAPAGIPTVLSFGKIESEGGATNVLTREVRLAGTFRTYNEGWRAEAHQWIERIAQGVAYGLGAELELKIVQGYPALSNDEGISRTVRQALQELTSPAAVHQLDLRPTAEDFAWYLQRVPGCFFRLGVRNEAAGIMAPVHTPNFDIDERALAYGAAGLAQAAIGLLAEDSDHAAIE